MSASEHIKELTIDSTLWTELNSISNTPDVSSKDLIEVYEVRYDNGRLYLVIDDLKGYLILMIMLVVC